MEIITRSRARTPALGVLDPSGNPPQDWKCPCCFRVIRGLRYNPNKPPLLCVAGGRELHPRTMMVPGDIRAELVNMDLYRTLEVRAFAGECDTAKPYIHTRNYRNFEKYLPANVGAGHSRHDA